MHRVRSDADRRVVLVSLTEKGEKAYHHHEKFHEDMIQSLLKRPVGRRDEDAGIGAYESKGFLSELQITETQDMIKREILQVMEKP